MNQVLKKQKLKPEIQVMLHRRKKVNNKYKRISLKKNLAILANFRIGKVPTLSSEYRSTIAKSVNSEEFKKKKFIC